MKNVTIKVDEDVAQWARVYAAERGSSVSRIVGAMLRERMEQEQGYERAHRRWKARRPLTIKSQDAGYPSRDELHER